MNKLTEFQKDFLRQLEFFTNRDGEYIWIPDYVAKKYEKVMQREDLFDQVNFLINEEIIKCDIIKKRIYNAKFVTQYRFIIL